MPAATPATSPAATPTPVAQPATAVTYLRVSTKEQAEKGGSDEGFSIPAQREANQRKAHELGAQVVAEFVDAGESARSADRPELQRLLGYTATHQVTYCIVHKIDRLARSRVDDVEIHRALVSAGVTLVSATENIDETPSGMLLHGIMSTIAEFYSRNLAAEVVKGMDQKVAQGGTPTRSPIGYLNVQRRDEQGRQVRTVEIDPERAPHIRFAFHTYAAGDVSVVELLRILTARGLTSVPSPSRPARPIGRSTLYKLLTNPYYVGRVRYRGAEHPGSHEPLALAETWHKVQSLLAARGADSTRHVTHDHYLKGTLYCGTCRSRMLLDFATNRQGTTYAYFICAGRAQKRTDCKRRAVPVGVAEDLVEDCYAQVRITEDAYRQLAERIGRAFDERAATRSEELADLTRNRARLETESEKLLAAHFADAIDLPTLKKHQDRIRIGLSDIDTRLATHHEEYATSRAHLNRALRLLADCHRLYRDSPPELRRLANQAFFERICITDDEQIKATLAEPFSELAEVRSSRKKPKVPLEGLEP